MVKGSKKAQVVEEITSNPLKVTELFKRYLDIKKATSIGNVHGVTVVIYDLLSISNADGWLFSSNDVKKILDHFGFKADYLVDGAVQARDDINKLGI